MKKLYLIACLVMAASMLSVQSVKAQRIDSNGQIVWLGSSINEVNDAISKGESVYLYNADLDLFLNAGLNYGVQGTMSSVGMRLTVKNVGTKRIRNNNGTYSEVTSGGNAYQNCYTIMGRIDNAAQGSYMSPNGVDAIPIYMDRKGTFDTSDTYSEPYWQFTQTGSTSLSVTEVIDGETQTNTYPSYTYQILGIVRVLKGKASYVGTNGNAVQFVASNGANTHWRFVTESDYLEAMDNVTWGEVDLGAFVQDAEFGRDNMDGRYWVWSTNGEGDPAETDTDAEGQTYTTDGWKITGSNIHWHQRNQDKMVNRVLVQPNATIQPATYGTNIGTTSYTGDFGYDSFRSACAQYYAAEIYNEVNSLTQQIKMSNVTNLTEGLYKLTAQALYHDGGDGTTNDDASYFVVKSTTDGVTITQELPIIPMNKVTNSITTNSGVSAGYHFDKNANDYVLQFFVEVKAQTTLEIGIVSKKANNGWTVIGNVHLYAHGKQALYIDEDWTENETLEYKDEKTGSVNYSHTGDPYQVGIMEYYQKYEYPATLYYQRTFNVGKWTTICLPISLTGSQVRQTFGNDCVLSELDKVTNTRIVFKAADLDTDGLRAGVPYIIRVSQGPQNPDGASLAISNGGFNYHLDIDGPVYEILGVTKDATAQMANYINAEVTGADGRKYTFSGTYYVKKILDPESSTYATESNQDNWVVTGGDMYHLTNTKPQTIWATYAYLHATPKVDSSSAGARVLSFAVEKDGVEDVITAIEGLTLDSEDGSKADGKMYNLSGQRVDDTYRGIVIVNGWKVMKK